MRTLFRNLTGTALAGLVLITGAGSSLRGQAPPFSINPMRLEVEAIPGVEKTVAFQIQAGGNVGGDRGRLVLSLTDWAIRSDGSVTYLAAGTEKSSAAAWMEFSPAALTITADRNQLVRVTIRVPEKTKAGVYHAAIFVQERPPATPPGSEMQLISVRIRFAFTLYVIVGPVMPQPELVNVDLSQGKDTLNLTCEMANAGTRHVRPLIFWNVRSEGGQGAESKGKIEATVLLPSARFSELYAIPQPALAPGKYEIGVMVDFQDGQPRQAMTRSFEVTGKPSVSVKVAFPEGTGSTEPNDLPIL